MDMAELRARGIRSDYSTRSLFSVERNICVFECADVCRRVYFAYSGKKYARYTVYFNHMK